ncbi:polyprenol reductase 1-like [Panicum virgatum]|uniref:polyprenol reductase 1-like n=1 Tax=Panicum virgatum TaxID=38727 RepID=UPI0019D4F2DC|nr:polyprenol reductase 1-like [Panicum virgatum]
MALIQAKAFTGALVGGSGGGALAASFFPLGHHYRAPCPEAWVLGLLCAFSSRGKTARASSSSSSSKVRFTVPQKFFLHFYVVGVVVTTTLLLAIWFYAYMKMTPLVPEPSSYSTIASHLVGSSDSFSLSSFWSSRPREHKYRVYISTISTLQRRLYETEHVFHYSPSARMHIMGYLTGLL